MANQENEKTYPVKTTHQFLSEITREWSRFKRGAVISAFISIMLILALVSGSIVAVVRGFGSFGDAIFIGLLLAFLLYSVYLMIGQYRFFRKWENRMKRLTTFEEQLMPENGEQEAAKASAP
jgi:membrane protein implicated in regulation of membrane protease activity